MTLFWRWAPEGEFFGHPVEGEIRDPGDSPHRSRRVLVREFDADGFTGDQHRSGTDGVAQHVEPDDGEYAREDVFPTEAHGPRGDPVKPEAIQPTPAMTANVADRTTEKPNWFSRCG